MSLPSEKLRSPAGVDHGDRVPRRVGGASAGAADRRIAAVRATVRRAGSMRILQKAMGPVLLIEDDGDTRALMTEFLGQAGYRVIASDEGRKALELAGATRPCLVLLDLRTGGMNGYQFLDRRRDEPALERVPVVVVTGAPRAVPPGVDAVFTKPVSPDELLRTIERLTRPRPRAPRGSPRPN